MKNTLKKLGVRIAELGQLLFVPEQTLHTWFNRKTTIPLEHSAYLFGFGTLSAAAKSGRFNIYLH